MNPTDRHSPEGSDSGDDRDIRAFLASPPEADPDPDRDQEARISNALAAYDLAIRSSARAGRRWSTSNVLGGVAAATVLLLAGTAGGFLAGRGADRTASSDALIESVSVRGNAPSCRPDETSSGAIAGAVVIGEREITVKVTTEPALRVTLVDALTCEIIVSLP